MAGKGKLDRFLDGWDVCRVRPFNLGWCFFPSKVVSDTPFLSPLWTILAKNVYTFDLTLEQKSTKIFAKSVHRQLRKEVYDTTIEGKTR